MIRSYEKGRFILESLFRGRHDFSARQMAELTWLISHRNIVEFLRAIPAHRQHRVRFEDLVSTPDHVLGGLCEWLEIPFVPEMADPYQGGSERMTDGIHPSPRRWATRISTVMAASIPRSPPHGGTATPRIS